MEVLQTSALPLGYAASVLERETGFEPATSTLARLHSTTELLPLNEERHYAPSAVLSTKDFHFFHFFLKKNEKTLLFQALVDDTLGLAFGAIQ